MDHDADALRVELATFKERVWSAIAHIRGEITSEVQRQVAPVTKALTLLETEVVTQQNHLFESTVAQGRTLFSSSSSYGDYAGPRSDGFSGADGRVLNALLHKMDAVDHDSRRGLKALTKLREGVKQLATDVATALLARADKGDFEAHVRAAQAQAQENEEAWRLALGDLRSVCQRDAASARAESAVAAKLAAEVGAEVAQAQETARQLAGRAARLEAQFDELATATRTAVEEVRTQGRRLEEEVRAYSRLSLAAPGAAPPAGRTDAFAHGGDSVVAGRWLWTSGRLVADPSGSGGGEPPVWVGGGADGARGASGWVRWDVQAACAAPALLLWAQPLQRVREGALDSAVTVTAVLPGLYRYTHCPVCLCGE